PVFDGAGRFAGYRGTAIDISAQRRFQTQLQQALAEFRDFATASGDHFWEVAPDGVVGRIIGEEGIAETLRQLFLDRPLTEVLEKHRVKYGAGVALLEHVIEGTAFRDLEFEIDNAAQTDRLWVRMSGVPYHDAIGEYAGMRMVSAIITASKQLSIQIEE